MSSALDASVNANRAFESRNSNAPVMIPSAKKRVIGLLSAVKRMDRIEIFPRLKIAVTTAQSAENGTQTAVRKQHDKGANMI